MRDYSEIKLGPIDRYKVWREKREAEKDRAWRDKIEHETSEVDYSEADKLEQDLLDKKRIKRATSDAKKIYKREKVEGQSIEEFIEDYLEKNGLKQKALPEPQQRHHAFMGQYPTGKSEEEKQNEEKRMYYVIDGVRYELPITASFKYFEQMKIGEIDIDKFPQLKTNDRIHYVIDADSMDPQRKYRVLEHITDCSISYVGEESYVISDGNIETEPLKSGAELGRKFNRISYFANKAKEEGRIEEANAKLEGILKEALKFRETMLRGDQNQERI